MKIFAGIDFGTTNTSAAISRGAAACLVRIDGENATIPSAIFFTEKDNLILFGRDAVNRYMDKEPGRFMRSLKRVLGTSLINSGTVVNGRPVAFQSILCAFIKNIKSKMDAAAGQSIEQVVMGRPVHFCENDSDGDARAEKELEQIAQCAGFKEVLFQYEPIAAAFAHERFLQHEQLAAVIDIGGGTSDFAIIRLGGDRAAMADRRDDILAASGVRVGGNDFDKQLSLRAFMPEFGMGTKYNAGTKDMPKMITVPTSHFFDLSEWSRINSIYEHKSMRLAQKHMACSAAPLQYGRLIEVLERQLGHKVLAAVEDAKISLSDADTTAAMLDFMSPKMEIPVNRKEFEQAVDNNMDKIIGSVKKCVNLANVSPNAVQLVILTGGSTEIPHVRDTLCGLFPNAKISDGDKLSSVGLGLAFDASRRFLR